ncbi:MAG: hypothetical protein JJT78_07020 [Leptospira sp.]|nr:hypothetical protein [Leptospira sp.]
MQSKTISIIVILIISVGFLLPSSISAEFTCTGNVCEVYPDIAKDFNRLLSQVEDEYLQEILKNNTESAFITNILATSPGRGHVESFQIGVGFSLAGVKKDEVVIQDDRAALPSLPNGGFAMSPSLHLDFNLGWLLRQDNRSYLRRFSVFVHGMSVRMSEKDLKGSSSLDANLKALGSVDSYGAMLRWQVVQPVGFGSYLFSWNGINLGAGAHYTRQEYSASYLHTSAQKVNWNEIEGRWGGDSNFNYKTKAETYHIDARTGLGAFWVFHIFAGGGYSWNRGESSVELERSGAYVLRTGSVNEFEIPREYQQFFDQDSLQESGILSLSTGASARSRRKMGYALAGFEIDFFVGKLTFEGVYQSKDLMGANLALRIAF